MENRQIWDQKTASEVDALILGDIDGSLADRDILLETQSKRLQRINESIISKRAFEPTFKYYHAFIGINLWILTLDNTYE
ncbi:hypothetical protein RIF29_04132 [Crotalaria pallida]|uniref:Uncharacterized protein n=1 Tax=Crotalaria pallida TaxID=3830 RepID=A0AAN9J236_CROPI